MARHNKAEIEKHADNSGKVTIQQQEVDTPILPPIEQLNWMQSNRPELIDWVIKETSAEADYRRKNHDKCCEYVYLERRLGQIFGLIIGLGGTVAGSVVSVVGSAKAGTVIATIAIGTLAVAFIGQLRAKGSE